MTTATTPVPDIINVPAARDGYGALQWPTISPTTRSRHGKHVRAVMDWIRTQDRFQSSGGDDWGAVNTDPYSISLRHEAILYQYRRAWGSKYGTQVRKSYWLATWDRAAAKHVVEREIPAQTLHAAVRAFPEDPAGAVEFLLGVRGKPVLPKRPRRPMPDIEGYKLVRVRRDEDGAEHYYSYYDGETEYVLGETTTDPAKPGHMGGLYMYLSPEMCQPDRIKTRVRRSEGVADTLAILEVIGSGKRVRYSRAGKYAVSCIMPVRVVDWYV